ncbi:MAG: phosphatidate cytidylyltransferase [Planctomycetota bacterium]|nr:phosphatidate cytidylyltransferase [Planctomycetota bacterium]
MLRQRLVTGILLIVGLIVVLWGDDRLSDALRQSDGIRNMIGTSDGVLLMALAILALAPLLARELAVMLRGAGIAAPTALTVLAAVSGVIAVRMAPAFDSGVTAVAVTVTALWAVFSCAIIVHSRDAQIAGVVAATGGTLLSFSYIGVLLGAWLLVRCQVGPWVLVGAVLTVKASDIGAYFTGMSIGRHKMIPWLSPAKSWEGLFGGIAFAAVIGGLLSWWSDALPDPRDHIPVLLGTATGAVLGVVGTFGDLVESLLKRSAGVKDSGQVLPGMGGVFDVVDSPLLAGPVVWWALHLR